MEQAKHISKELRSAVAAIKDAILQSQYQAAKGVNAVQLSLYYGIGKYVSEKSRQGAWGTGAIAAISEQLQKELPGLRGFSEANIKFMRQFYESWNEPMANSLTNVSDLHGENEYDNQPVAINSLTAVSEIAEIKEFLSLGFSHHMMIIRKTESVEERLFYIHQAIVNQWNKYQLKAELDNKLYHHQSTLPNNFAATMPNRQSVLRALEMFKDEYLLDFINVEEIGERDRSDIDEREVEKAIIHNVKNFIMTFGHDFTFVGNQYHLEKYGHSMFPDLLFYNRELAALVVVELKRGEFKPAYLGQLSAYLRILDAEVKKPFENPSIGIILCKQADKSFVEFLIQGYDNPMGVATYKTADDVRKALPSEEELRRVMDEDV